MSVSGDIVTVFDKEDNKLATIYTYCPDTAIKFFFTHYRTKEARFELWKRIWHAYSNMGEYTKKQLGLFTAEQVKNAGNTPVAQVIDLTYEPAVEKKQEGVVSAKGASPYSRSWELASAGKTKEEAFAVLLQEFPNRPEPRIKGMVHSVWAQFKKKGENKT